MVKPHVDPKPSEAFYKPDLNLVEPYKARTKTDININRSMIYISVQVCMYTNKGTHIYIYILIHTDIHIIYICTCIYTCMYAYTYIHMYICMPVQTADEHSLRREKTLYMHMYMYICICLCMYVCMHAGMYVHTYIYIYLYAYMRPQTCMPAQRYYLPFYRGATRPSAEKEAELRAAFAESLQQLEAHSGSVVSPAARTVNAMYIYMYLFIVCIRMQICM